MIPCLMWMMRVQWRISDEAIGRTNSSDSQQQPDASDYATSGSQAILHEEQVSPRQQSVRSAASPKAEKAREASSLSDLDPSQNPLIPSSVYEPSSANPLSVIYIGTVMAASNTTTDDIVLLDALERSRYTQVCDTYLVSLPNYELRHQQWHKPPASSDTPLAIVVDWSYRDCHVLQRILSRHVHDDVLPSAYLMLLDSTASTRTVICDGLPIPTERIRIAKRSIIEGRHWNHTRQWVEPGSLIANNHKNILHWPGYVSESFLSQLRYVVADAQADKSYGRPLETSHYWQSSENIATSLYYNVLRQRVTRQLNETQGYLVGKNEPAKFVDRVGMGIDEDASIELEVTSEDTSDEEEDVEVSLTTLHIALLASSKIVVVAQNDEWEDHDNRLMEALASGAMVLADVMQAPPAGLKNKTNIVFYDGAASLHRLIRYYLSNNEKREKIARHGVQFALGRHRSWHVLESLLFGKAMTRTDKEPFNGEGPPKREHSLSAPAETVVL